MDVELTLFVDQDNDALVEFQKLENPVQNTAQNEVDMQVKTDIALKFERNPQALVVRAQHLIVDDVVLRKKLVHFAGCHLVLDALFDFLPRLLHPGDGKRIDLVPE